MTSDSLSKCDSFDGVSASAALMGYRGRRVPLVAALAAALLAGCASVPNDPAERAEFEAVNDPLEPANRYVFAVNGVLDVLFLRPAADTYRQLLPDFVQGRVHGVYTNMLEPVVLANEVLQGRAGDFFNTLGRFVLNSTFGIGGMFDVAAEVGLPAKEADFGQTLYTWGVTDGGPYLVLPVVGPSNPRDGIGLAVDSVFDPVGWAFGRTLDLSTANYSRTGAQAVDTRAGFLDQTDSLERTSLDYYAAMRSMSRQFREKHLKGETASPSASIPSYDTESGAVAER